MERRTDRPENHLKGQTSPYLLQHVHNPVDWYPWGEEALARARDLDRPILVSIGYAACHWCHVMERESFEDDAVASLLNAHFVPIKVDREERPDIDEIYMNAVQLMTGQGGWPLNMFLTPDLRPFLGGTYFPPQSAYGRIGFAELLERIRDAWRERRDEIGRSADEVTDQLRKIAAGISAPGAPGPIGADVDESATAHLSRRFDAQWGGFGAAPKFPPDQALALLLREHHRTGETAPLRMASFTLDRMATGGMYDHVGGGFARYSVDERWLVPHFEKMLYNQALLVPVYADAWRLTGSPLYRRVVLETLDFVRRELTDPAGGFWASLDADSEGEEGRFYVWTPGEIHDVLGPEDGAAWCSLYGVSEAGHFEGKSIPNLLGGTLADHAERERIDERSLERALEPMRTKLLERRGTRVRPSTDDKVLTAWSGLMITAYCRGYQAFGRDDDLASAERAARFLLDTMYVDGRLRVSFREGRSRLNGYLDDYAFLGRACIDLYESTFDASYLEAAWSLVATAFERFSADDGTLYFVSDDHENLLTRNRSSHDSATPSGAGVVLEAALRLAHLLDRKALRERAERSLEAYRAAIERAPDAFASMLCAAHLAREPWREIAIVGRPESEAFRELTRRAHRPYVPSRVVVGTPSESTPGEPSIPWLADKRPDGDATGYVCSGYACRAPTADPDRFEAAVTDG